MTDRSSRIRADLAVILCTFNGAQHLREQVMSILDQDLLPGEIRLYDDGSSDDSVEVVRLAWSERAADAQAVGLHVAPPAERSFGAAGNFARAMADTRSPLLALSDQDDVWDPNRLVAALAVFDADPDVELVTSDALMTDGAGRSVGRTVFEAQRLTNSERDQFRADNYLPALLRRNLFPGMTFTVRRDLVDRLGALPHGAMHDYWLVAAAAARGTLRVIPRPLVRYRIHSGNSVGLDTGRRGLVERVRVKARAFRAPLTDLPQWTELPKRLRSAGDVDAAERIESKTRFEISRRFPNRSPRARAATLVALLRGTDYLQYEFQGRAAALRDGLRRPDPHLVKDQ